MLHEILLGLAGHGNGESEERISGLSAWESGVLASLTSLGSIYAKIEQGCEQIDRHHDVSVVRQAVGNWIRIQHLGEFRSRIIDVETRILQRDSALVGAGQIVPLTSLASEFEPWVRRLRWYDETVRAMLEVDPNRAAVQVMEYLRTALKTGYGDVEIAARDLCRVAEQTWMKLLSAWIVYGRLTEYGSGDFFVQSRCSPENINGTHEPGIEEFYIDDSRVPWYFVTREALSAILFMGKCRRLDIQCGGARSSREHIDIVTGYQSYANALTFPLTSGVFFTFLRNVHTRFFHDALQRTLPVQDLTRLLDVLYAFFMLERGEFSTCLIHEADAILSTRHAHIITQSEAHAALARTWASLLSTTHSLPSGTLNANVNDCVIDVARNLMRVSDGVPRVTGGKRVNVTLPTCIERFHEHLFAIPISLTISVPKPFNIFFTKEELNVYSSVNAYLLSIRRTLVHLTDLWRQGNLRKGNRNSIAYGQRCNWRAGLRRVWATCSCAIFFLSELNDYFSGSIVKRLYEKFRAWIYQRLACTHTDADGLDNDKLYNPQTLIEVHAKFLREITRRLLMTDEQFTSGLHTFLLDTDLLMKSFLLLERIQKISSASQGTDSESREITQARCAVSEAAHRVNEDMTRLLECLEECDKRWTTSAENGELRGDDGLDRLLMKLNFGKFDDGSAKLFSEDHGE